MGPVLPFSAEALDALIGLYNLAIWPVPLLGAALAAAAVAHSLRPVRGGDHLVAALLAVAWGWVGIVFHVRQVAAIDFMAPVYGAFFVLQALLLAWAGATSRWQPLRFRPDVGGWTGLGLATVAVVGYPILAVLTGHDWPRIPFASTAPDPTVMLTLGLLMLSAGPVRLYLLAVPVLWSLVAGMTALSLDTPDRLILPAAAGLAVGVELWIRRRRPSA
ncbi:MAG: DUF6064 family protein [Thalassobaculum sp.]|uniref:DUF6064 family protein n=1 Tax=Thalassobaculum sp. TaxID=2022740 RepID=UPI0032EED3DE